MCASLPAPILPFCAPGQIHLVDDQVTLHRLHWEADPNEPDPKEPRWRFDDPWGQRLVTYANESERHVFAEVYGDLDGDGVITANQASRRISRVIPSEPLRLIDFGDAATLRAVGVDGRVHTDTDYGRTQLWGDVVHAWCQEADGILFPGRKAGRRDNRCLFLDRCRHKLVWEYRGTLVDNRRLVMEACVDFGLYAELFYRPTPRGW